MNHEWIIIGHCEMCSYIGCSRCGKVQLDDNKEEECYPDATVDTYKAALELIATSGAGPNQNDCYAEGHGYCIRQAHTALKT